MYNQSIFNSKNKLIEEINFKRSCNFKNSSVSYFFNLLTYYNYPKIGLSGPSFGIEVLIEKVEKRNHNINRVSVV